MTNANAAPAIVRWTNPLSRLAIRAGLPMGPNTLLTVRGRSSGEPRSAPVAVLETDGRLFVIGAYGEVHWTRNLRAAGEATVRLRGADRHVTARELESDEALEFFRTTLPGYIRGFPWYGRAFARVFFGLIGPEFLNDPDRAAATRPVFELRPDPA